MNNQNDILKNLAYLIDGYIDLRELNFKICNAPYEILYFILRL